MPNKIAQGTIDWAVASRVMPGETVCGDLHMVKPIADGVLVSVVDGLGHGDEALAAAQAAVVILEQHADQPLDALIRRCHEALGQTRGAVITLVRLSGSDSGLTWLGIGNVEAVLLRAGSEAKAKSERLLLRGGLVGYQLPKLQFSRLPIAPGDLLVIATDGIAPAFPYDVVRSASPRQIADGILRRHFKGSDDALVLVARYVGHGHK